ncbi:MAG TPA: Uma2 family endonuclease [Tepidisphaeraceae bacterium]|nr:Uma2 family endonuclease [Tepidisphaeraceae bacterium]
MTTSNYSPVKELRWTVRKYDQLLANGLFRNAHVELVAGRIIKMAPKLEPHVASVSLSAKAVERSFGDGYWVRRQDPLHLGAYSKPEPDVAVVAGTEIDYVFTGAPRSALLVIEVSESSLRYDRLRKASLYARFGIADYWIVNLVDRQLEIYREPVADPLHRFRFRYGEMRVVKPEEFATPLASHIPMAVSAMLPPHAPTPPGPLGTIIT